MSPVSQSPCIGVQTCICGPFLPCRLVLVFGSFQPWEELPHWAMQLLRSGYKLYQPGRLMLQSTAFEMGLSLVTGWWLCALVCGHLDMRMG